MEAEARLQDESLSSGQTRVRAPADAGQGKRVGHVGVLPHGRLQDDGLPSFVKKHFNAVYMSAHHSLSNYNCVAWG